MKAGAVYKYDVSIPVENLYNLVEEMRSRLGRNPMNVTSYITMVHIRTSTLLQFCYCDFCLIIVGDAANVIGYGHLGDGNLHLNVSVPQYDDKVAQTNSQKTFVMNLLFFILYKINSMKTLQILSQIEPFVYEWTSKKRGSISAEHGMGLMKANEIFYSQSHETVCILLAQIAVSSPFENVNL